jgi:hypothetical protein
MGTIAASSKVRAVVGSDGARESAQWGLAGATQNQITVRNAPFPAMTKMWKSS